MKAPSPPLWIGVAIIVLVGVFIARNTEDVYITRVVFDVTMSLKLALTIAAVPGFVAGWPIGRRRV